MKKFNSIKKKTESNLVDTQPEKTKTWKTKTRRVIIRRNFFFTFGLIFFKRNRDFIFQGESDLHSKMTNLVGPNTPEIYLKSGTKRKDLQDDVFKKKKIVIKKKSQAWCWEKCYVLVQQMEVNGTLSHFVRISIYNSLSGGRAVDEVGIFFIYLTTVFEVQFIWNKRKD